MTYSVQAVTVSLEASFAGAALYPDPPHGDDR